ncbi:Uu.00g041580.m01.CDS01 [Anthostomella pinea]|uniref:Uu.00g041580.m01.CDS01 n=1 Tax=Anthostomella pinea TaxID=933095 RepID=A0AAI8VAF0_9PEZI|nr:Uu.00g041580.m01.CDS01 [Anthostomella pinea]
MWKKIASERARGSWSPVLFVVQEVRDGKRVVEDELILIWHAADKVWFTDDMDGDVRSAVHWAPQEIDIVARTAVLKSAMRDGSP